jgi:hypothetical protein
VKELILTSAQFEVFATTGFGVGTLTTDDKLRISWTTIGNGAADFTVTLELEEP